MRRSTQQGAVLITALLLVVVLSVLAIGFAEAMRFDIQRTAQAQARTQALWHAYGAEDFAEIAMTRLWRAQGDRPQLDPQWAREGFVLPVDNGSMRLRIGEGGNCLNLNSVVRPGPDGFQVDPVGLAQYRALLTALGVDAGQARLLAAALLDWADSNGTPWPGGAEDAVYGTRTLATRAANTLLADISELRVIEGYDKELIERLRPFICALPTSDLSPINVNALTLTQAPLLVAMLEGEIDGAAAQRLIEDRPDDGFVEIDAFWAMPQFDDITISARLREQPRLASRFLTLTSELWLDGAGLTMHTLFEQRGGGDLRPVRRQLMPPLPPPGSAL